MITTYRQAFTIFFGMLIVFFHFELSGQISRPIDIPLAPQFLEKFVLPAQDNEALMQEEMSRGQKGRPPKFATAIPVRISPGTHGRWDQLGGWSVWRFRLASPGAHSLNLGFSRFHLPEEGKFFIYRLDNSYTGGPFTPADNESHNQLWTPIIPGDELVLEIQLPDRKLADLELELAFVNHDFLGLAQQNSEACNLDVVCGADDGWDAVEPFRDASRSVGLFSIDGTFLCTGFLVNNTKQDCTPYFVTAAHCEVTPENASSVVVYWNYVNSTCRQPDSVESGQDGNGQFNDFNTGAFFRASWSNSDFSLIELDDPVTETANAYFAGWSAEDGIPGGTVACVHHPFSDEKRISLSDQEIYTGFWGSSEFAENGTHLILSSWTTGTTQSGSSGGPLFNEQGQAIGQLHGGDASCTNNLYDAFGRFYNSWEGGGTADSRLKDWLDPLGSGNLSLPGRDQNRCDFGISSTLVSKIICIGDTDTLTLYFGPGYGPETEVMITLLEEGAGIQLEEVPVVDPQLFKAVIKTTAATPAGDYRFKIFLVSEEQSDTIFSQLKVLDQIPEIPVLIFPPDQAEGQALQLLLGWHAQTGAETYELQLAADPAFSSPLVDLQIPADSTTAISGLQGETTYYWRVAALNVCGRSAWSAVRSFSTLISECHSDTAADVPVTIPGETVSTVSSTILIEQPGKVTGIEIVNLDIQHRWVGDLALILQSPSGTQITLMDRAGFPDSPYGCNGSDLLLSFNQNIGENHQKLETTCGSIPPAVAGTFQPLQSLSALYGEKADGPWQLFVKDHAEEDGGQLKGWQLNICVQPPDAAIITGLSNHYQGCVDQPLLVDIVIGEGFSGAEVDLFTDQTPMGATVTFSKNPAVAGDTIRITLDNLLIPGMENMTIGASDGMNTAALSIDIDIEGIPDSIQLLEPAPESQLSTPDISFLWSAVAADSFLLEIASDMEFKEIIHAAHLDTNAYQFQLADEQGEFFWRVTAMNSCGSTTGISSFLLITTAATDLGDGRQVRVFPNPFTDRIDLELDRSLGFPLSFRLIDISGRIRQSGAIPAGTLRKRLNTGQTGPGIYFLELRYQGERYIQKLIKPD